MRKRKKRGRGDGPGVKTVEDRGGKDRVGKLVRTDGEGLEEGPAFFFQAMGGALRDAIGRIIFLSISRARGGEGGALG